MHELGGHDLSAFFGFTPQISFHVSTERNAYAAYPYEVVLTTGLIESCYNRAELAFVIAHELGHLYKRHASGSALVNDRTIASDQRLEVEADRFAAELLDGAQYGRLAGRLVLARLAALEGTRTGENQSLLEERLALLSK